MSQELYQILRKSTVKIFGSSEKTWSTGFYISPNLIITCSHGFDFKRASSFLVYSELRKDLFEVEVLEFSQDLDVAIFMTLIDSQDYICFGNEVKPGDELYTYGFPDDFDEGAPTTFRCEGITGGKKFIKFKEGQVRPGLSGSPLLNQATGKVCGIVKFTRSRNSSLGGGGISVQSIEHFLTGLSSRAYDPSQPNSAWENASKTFSSKSNSDLHSIDREIFRARIKIIKAVEIFLEDWLKRTLHGNPINLSFEVRSDLIKRPSIPKITKFYTNEVVSNTSISDFFESPLVSGKLLILGMPGAGKTIAIIRLAKHLLNACKNDFEAPIPLFLQLSTWNNEPIIDWIKVGLNLYGVPDSKVDKLLVHLRFTPLLDGLDELDVNKHIDCLKAINIFIREESRLAERLVVSSRLDEYARCRLKLQLHQSILIVPVEADKLEQYFSDLGKRALYEQISENIDLKEIISTPIFLFVLISLCRDSLFVLPQSSFSHESNLYKSISTSESLRRNLFSIYVREALSREEEIWKRIREPGINETKQWLSSLAKSMEPQSRSFFLIEGIQPSLLKRNEERYYRGILSLLSAVFSIPGCILVVYFLSTSKKTLDSCTTENAFCGLVFSSMNSEIILIGILMSIFLGVLLGLSTKEIAPVESLRLSLRDFLNVLRHANLPERLASAFIVNLRFPAELVAVGNNLRSNYPIWLSYIVRALGGLLLPVTLPFRIFSSKLRKVIFDLETRNTPNQAIWRNTFNSFLSGFILSLFGFFLGTFLGVIDYDQTDPVFSSFPGTENGIENLTKYDISLGFVGLSVGLLLGLLLPGIASIQHLSLRITMWCFGYCPWNYKRFLDYASKKMLLQKVGGRYQFIHDLLRVYFAQLENQDATESVN